MKTNLLTRIVLTHTGPLPEMGYTVTRDLGPLDLLDFPEKMKKEGWGTRANWYYVQGMRVMLPEIKGARGLHHLWARACIFEQDGSNLDPGPTPNSVSTTVRAMGDYWSLFMPESWPLLG